MSTPARFPNSGTLRKVSWGNAENLCLRDGFFRRGMEDRLGEDIENGERRQAEEI
jgi:hypothetical protein